MSPGAWNGRREAWSRRRPAAGPGPTGLGLVLGCFGCVAVFPISADRHRVVRWGRRRRQQGRRSDSRRERADNNDEDDDSALRNGGGEGGRRRATTVVRGEGGEDVVPLASLCQLKLKQLSQRHPPAIALRVAKRSGRAGVEVEEATAVMGLLSRRLNCHGQPHALALRTPPWS